MAIKGSPAQACHPACISALPHSVVLQPRRVMGILQERTLCGEQITSRGEAQQGRADDADHQDGTLASHGCMEGRGPGAARDGCCVADAPQRGSSGRALAVRSGRTRHVLDRMMTHGGGAAAARAAAGGPAWHCAQPFRHRAVLRVLLPAASNCRSGIGTSWHHVPKC